MQSFAYNLNFVIYKLLIINVLRELFAIWFPYKHSKFEAWRGALFAYGDDTEKCWISPATFWASQILFVSSAKGRN